MLGLKVDLAHAQAVKRYLVDHELLERSFRITRNEDSITFPVVREFSPPFDFDVDFVEAELDERELTQNLKEAVYEHLTPEERKHLRTAYDIVGSIAIIDIMPELASKERLIGQKILENNRTIKTVLKKIGGHEGIYRTQAMQCIAGEDTRETIVTENGIKLRVDVENAYYSIRMATERKRIAKLVQPGEKVLCLFSGIGPYPIMFSKHTQASDIVGIEINPRAYELAVENVAKNRCLNVRLFCADAHDLLPRLAEAGERFDRVTMPLPRTGGDFLDDVMAVLKRGATIHFYGFYENGRFDHGVVKLRETAKLHGYTLKNVEVIRAGQQAPRIWRICVDATLH